MFGTTLTTIILGVISGVGASWATDQKRWGLALLLTVLTFIFAVVAFTTGFAGAVSLVFRYLPVLLIALVAWLGYKQLQHNRQDR